MSNTPLKRVLYVESDKALAAQLEKRMENRPYTLDTAYSSEEALKKLPNGNYELVLLDYYMPSISGLDLLDKIKALPGTPPVIFLTASGDERMALAALERGAVDYAIKDSGQAYFDLLPAIMQAAHTRERLLRITEQQHQELIIAKEKAETANVAKSAFLATMSHEMRTPLNVIIGIAGLLSRGELAEKERDMTRTLLSNADLLMKLINDMLDLSRIEAGLIELESNPFSLSQVFDDIRVMFESEMARKKLRFRLEEHTQGRIVMGDRTRVQQIVMNLVSNALKFTPEGEIHVIGRCADEDGKAAITIEVRDTGVGIPTDKLDAIFEKFTQADGTIARRFGGSGLGLSIARSFAEIMGGGITVKSTPGKGSIFILRLLLPDSAQQIPANTRPSDKKTETIPADACSGTVLVVEDYSPNVMVASMMLENMGFNVQVAEDGKQALAQVRSAATPYVAILMDVQMHDMDGLETTRQIREMEKTKAIRNTIIGVTAHALAGDRERCLAAGMDDYISKPIHPDILSAKLKSLCSQQPEAA